MDIYTEDKATAPDRRRSERRAERDDALPSSARGLGLGIIIAFYGATMLAMGFTFGAFWCGS